MIKFYKIGNNIYKENEEGLYETSSIRELYDEYNRLNNIIDYTTRYIQDEKRGVKYISDILLILRGEVYLDKNNMLQDINEKK